MSGTPADVFNRFCQLRGVAPSITFGTENRSVSCSISVPGIAIRTEGLGSTKQDAKTKATADYVQILQNHGLMQTPPKIQQKKRKASAPSGSAAKRHGHARPVSPGPVPVGRVPAKRMQCSDVITGKMVELLRANKLQDAVQKLQEMVKTNQFMNLKQIAKLADSIGMRTSEAACRDFFDALEALDLVEAPSAAGQKYFGRFVRWALREFPAESKSTVDLAKNVPGHVLERNGSCLQVLLSPGSKASQLVAKPAVPSTNCSFQRGDWILLTFPHTSRPSEVANNHWGHPQHMGVTGVSAGICAEAEIQSTNSLPEVSFEVRIMGEAVDGVAAKLKDKTCRMDKIANHVTLSRQLDALQKVCSVDPGKQWNAHLIAHAMRQANNEKDNQEAAWVKNLLLCADSPHAGKEPDLAAEEVAFSLSPHNPLLLEANESQRHALLSACGRQLTLIQGPPGTGKTTTALLLVRAWVFSNKRPVLCAADSNIAVDNLVDGCAKAHLHVVRVGRPEATRMDLEQYNLLEMVKGMDPKTQFGRQKQILSEADVVCSTCSGADHPLIQHMTFARVLLDEAAQATELSSLVPLMKMKPEACVTLVGDHRQLPPTISNVQVDVEGFGTSLFERMAGQGVQPYLLNIQYRMHPCISAFPSSMYYDGQIRSGIAGASRRPPQGIAWPAPEVPVTFLPVAGQELSKGTSWSNKSEVEAVQELLKSLCAWDDISQEEVGIITPYAAQARLLRRTLGCPAPGKRGTGGMTVEVSSVDGFQGREKDVIIVSTVRANSRGSVGFVGDPRRLNVTLTRAKRGLVVVGCFETLSHDQNGWGPWLHWAQERGLVAGCSATAPEAAEALTSLGTLTTQQLLNLGAASAATL